MSIGLYLIRTALSFLMLAYSPPRDLHSFPTRRSSDLKTIVFITHMPPQPVCLTGQISGYWASPAVLRSEEHTSELQSQFQLVCRLLLEKKKKPKKPDTQTPMPS